MAITVFCREHTARFLRFIVQDRAICFLAIGAMTPLITREFSIAYSDKNLGLMMELFRKHVFLSYSVTAFIAYFVAINADKITLIMGRASLHGKITGF